MPVFDFSNNSSNENTEPVAYCEAKRPDLRSETVAFRF